MSRILDGTSFDGIQMHIAKQCEDVGVHIDQLGAETPFKQMATAGHMQTRRSRHLCRCEAVENGKTSTGERWQREGALGRFNSPCAAPLTCARQIGTPAKMSLANCWLLCVALLVGLASPVFAQDYPADLNQRSLMINEIPFSTGDVDPYEGNLKVVVPEVRIPGNGHMDVVIYRSYNNARIGNPDYGQQIFPNSLNWMFGMGWNLGLFPRIITQVPNPCNNSYVWRLAIELPTGEEEILYRAGSNDPNFYTKNGWRYQCAALPLLFSPEGISYEMGDRADSLANGASGNPDYTTSSILSATRARDTNGNWITASYTNLGYAQPHVPTQITTSDGRSVQITYNNGKVSNIVGPNGLTWQYEQGTGLKLKKVTLPNGQTHQYTYYDTRPSGLSDFDWAVSIDRLKSITGPYGGTTTYEYKRDQVAQFWFGFEYCGEECGWILPDNPTYSRIGKKTSSDGGVWTFTYNPSFTQGQYDVTTVSGPSGTAAFKYIGRSFDVSSPGQRFSNSLYPECQMWDAEVTKVGLLAEKSIGSSYTETYQWTLVTAPRLPATSAVSRSIAPLGSPPSSVKASCEYGSYNPALSRKTITLNGAQYVQEQLAHNPYGQPTVLRETGPNGEVRTTTYSYYSNLALNIVSRLDDEIVTGASSLTREWDSTGRVLSVTKDGVTTSYTYTSAGDLASSTKPGGRVTTFSQYKRGIPQHEAQPESITITRVVDDAGRVASETDGEGHTKGYTYDGLGRPTSIDYPLGNDTSISYTANTKSVTRGGLVQSTTYDGFGRLKNNVLGGIATTYTYDALGRRTFQSNPGNSSIGTSYQYDALNQVTRVTNADSTYRTYTYGPANITMRDERGNYTTYSYRGYGDPDASVLIGIVAANPTANILITRGVDDLVTGITQAGLTRTFGYDARKYLVSETHPEMGTTTYGRDAAGNMTSRTIGGATTSFVYDGHNRLTSVSHADGTPNVSQTYSKAHKLRTVTSSAASRVMAYDANDNLTSESLTIGAMQLGAQYSYTGNDQLATTTYPVSGRVVSYSPDVLGRPTQVAGYVNAITYWPSGVPSQIDYVNGIVTNYDQNSRLWPSAFRSRRSGTHYVNSAYGYDGVGNLISINDAADATLSRTLGYDTLNRLTSAAGPWGTGTLTYDGAGNITSQNLGSFNLSYAYPTQNRLGSVSGSRSASYSYDIYGNISAASGTTYQYDGVPNLRCINCASSNMVEYTYDGLGKRVTVTKSSATTYEFYASSGDLLVEYSPSQSNKLVEYMYLGGKRVAQRVSDNRPPTTITMARSTTVENRTRGVTLTVNLGGITPTGTVTFMEGGTMIGTVYVSNGQANIDVQGLALGNHTITATYSGDASNSGNTVVFQIKVVNLDWLPAVLQLLLSN